LTQGCKRPLRSGRGAQTCPSYPTVVFTGDSENYERR
jgi:hypothetical protein